jgi:hypothetical protein
MERPSAGSELLQVVQAHASGEALAWLQRGLPRAGAFARGAFFGFYAGAGRRFAGPALGLAGAERLRGVGIDVPEVFSLSDLARCALLVAAMEVAEPSVHLSLATEAFRRGDNGERVALLRALTLLPQPERFTELAIEACRTHVLDVFAAIACENAFPARHFPELHFNQLVIKAMFLELALERVLGWRERNNPELRRMAADYAAERRAAGRSVPVDLAAIQASMEAS